MITSADIERVNNGFIVRYFDYDWHEHSAKKICVYPTLKDALEATEKQFNE